MFFFIPLIVFLSSIAIMIGITARKFTYLKKLTPGVVNSSASTQDSFWAEFFPGLATWFKKKNIRESRINFLAEFEKFLRRFRLISLRIDTLTNQLIHRVRKSAAYHEEILNKESTPVEPIAGLNGNGKKKDWKEEEQRLIIEIAKNPKDAGLYKELGKIYVKMGESQDAFESFKKSLELGPDDEEVKSRLEKVTTKLKNLPA